MKPSSPDAQPDPGTTAALLDRARSARVHAYAPYSGFRVGAALLAEDGTVITGCNVENASFGVTNCAERVALQSAVAAGHRRFRAIAVAGPDDGAACTPCGSCRQALHEFAPGLWVVMRDGSGSTAVVTLAELLPAAFGPDRLQSGAADARERP